MGSTADSPWGDVSTEDRLGRRFDAFQATLDTRFTGLDETIERAFRRQTITLIVTLGVYNTLLAVVCTVFF